MKEGMRNALAEYGRLIKEQGFKAGEPIIQAREKKFQDFRRWAYALAIMLRAEEILSEDL